MILLDGKRVQIERVEIERVEMQRGQHDQVAGALFEYLIQVPDFEVTAHADQQRALAHPAPRSHPGGNTQPPPAVHLRGRDEP